MNNKIRAALWASIFLALLPFAFAQDAPKPKAREPSFDLVVRTPDKRVRELLQRHLELGRYREVPDLDDAEYVRLMALAERDARQLLGTLGYFAPQVKVTREQGAGKPSIVVAVDAGTQASVRSVDIAFEGDIAGTAEPGAVAQREGIRAGWGLRPGQPFTQELWSDAKSAALRRLTSKRYLRGRLADSVADIDAATSSAHLGLRFDSGAVYHLGAMEVHGMQRYDERLVPRIAHLPPGSEYDQERIQQAQLKLAGSGYFDSAFIYVDPEGDPAAVPVQVTVREAPLQKLVLGLGMTTDSGARATVEHTHNRLPGIGWRALTKLQLERKNPFAQTEWTAIPDESGWRWNTLARVERIEDGDLITHGKRLRFGRFIAGEHIDRNVYLEYDRADVHTASGVPVNPADAGDGASLSVNYQWTRRHFDNLLIPSEGYGLAFEVGGGFTLDGGRQPFQRTVVRWLQFHPLKEGRLKFRAEGGAVIAKPSAHVPSTQMFRTGGDTTVRGYGYRDIGVPFPDGRIGPGRLMAVGSVEWQKPIRRAGATSDLEAIAFVDAGAVADHVSQLRPNVGAGAGVRWKSPVGPLEAAVAYGFKVHRFRLHLSVGFTF
jgi:translocation and assembly module TamA